MKSGPELWKEAIVAYKKLFTIDVNDFDVKVIGGPWTEAKRRQRAQEVEEEKLNKEALVSDTLKELQAFCNDVERYELATKLLAASNRAIIVTTETKIINTGGHDTDRVENLVYVFTSKGFYRYHCILRPKCCEKIQSGNVISGLDEIVYLDCAFNMEAGALCQVARPYVKNWYKNTMQSISLFLETKLNEIAKNGILKASQSQ